MYNSVTVFVFISFKDDKNNQITAAVLMWSQFILFYMNAENLLKFQAWDLLEFLSLRLWLHCVKPPVFICTVILHCEQVNIKMFLNDEMYIMSGKF